MTMMLSVLIAFFLPSASLSELQEVVDVCFQEDTLNSCDLLEEQPDNVVQWTAEFFCQKDLRFIVKRQTMLDKNAKVSSLTTDLKKISEIGNKLNQEAHLAATTTESEIPTVLESSKSSVKEDS